MPGGIFQGIPQVFFLRATLPLWLLKHFLLFQSTMNFNFVETHVFTKLDISLNIFFSFASLVDFLGLENSVWKNWPKIPLTLCTKLWGLVAPPKLFFIFFHILQVWFYYQNEKDEGVSQRKIIFLFLVNHPSIAISAQPYLMRVSERYHLENTVSVLSFVLLNNPQAISDNIRHFIPATRKHPFQNYSTVRIIWYRSTRQKSIAKITGWV